MNAEILRPLLKLAKSWHDSADAHVRHRDYVASEIQKHELACQLEAAINKIIEEINENAR